MGADFELRRESGLFPIFYALQLFATMIHEMGHSVVCLLTGGRVVGFVVNGDTGGYALLQGGIPFFTLPAGYLGTAVFGSLFFYLSNRYRSSKVFATVIGTFIILFTLIFGRPEKSGMITTHLVTMGFGIVLLLVGIKGPLWLNRILINIVTIMTALQAIFSALVLVTFNRPWHDDDAVFFSRMWGSVIPPSAIAATWALIAAALFAVALFFSIKESIKEQGVSLVG